MQLKLIRNITFLVAAAALGLVSTQTHAQSVGNCEQSTAEAFLDINNIRAKIMNNGGIVWNGGDPVYEFPKGGGENTIFASGIWMGGLVDGQLRLAGSTYGPWEFWAGPLNDDGTSQSDCSPWDRLWKVSKEDVIAFDGGAPATPDLQDWPTGLGAPTLDANGDLIDLLDQPLASRIDRKINLAAGERPQILGDQLVWWIMNDMGNQHNRTDTPPMGIEGHGSAFAFNSAGALGNTTFYKFRLFYKGTVPLVDTYMGIFSDPDLGQFTDDYVGSDTTLGLGFVYNADDDDEGHYGPNVPASGYDFFQGPLVDSNGIDDNGDGQIDEEGERLKMTAFAFYNNGGGVTGDPQTGPDMYNYMRGRWKDGQRFTLGGNGRDFSTIPTSFMFPGNPATAEFWSEINSDGQGTAITPADRRFVMASGPFEIQPGDEQEIVFGLVSAFAPESVPNDRKHLEAVTQMKIDDAVAQTVFDSGFQVAQPPAAPRVTVTELDGGALLEWGYERTDNNFLDQYVEIDPLLSPDVADRDYVFEGYNVIRFSSTGDSKGRIIATFDKVNGITRVIEGEELTFITADGTDSGIQHSFRADNLTNYTTVEFGVEAYAYNETSGAKVIKSPVTRVSVTPSRPDFVMSDDAVALSRLSAEFDIESTRGDNVGNGNVTAKVVNPAKVTGDDYRLEFFTTETGTSAKRGDVVSDADRINDATPKHLLRKSASAEVLAYDVVNTTTGTKVFDGTAAAAALGKNLPEGNGIVRVDGLSINISGAPNDFLGFRAVANAAGPIVPDIGAAADFQGFPGSLPRANADQQVGGGRWFFHTFESGSGSYQHFLNRSVLGRANGWTFLVPFDFEMRFTAEGGYAWNAFTDGSVIKVPFELWRVGISTPDDPSDDVRLIPWTIDWDGDGYGITCEDHSTSGGDNDPEMDAVYWHLPSNTAPGRAGYDAWEAEVLATGDGAGDAWGTEVFGRTVLVNFNGGSVANCAAPQAWDATTPSETNFTADVPEEGTVIRLLTTKPNQPGDTFSFSTDGLGARQKTQEEAVAALDEIGIVPNPYKGASAYEVSQLTDQVRFTNLPNRATIRIFTLNGTLINTLEKNSPANFFPWNLATEDNLPIASGMYLIHVDTDLGEKVLKFAVIKKRVQLNTF